MNSSYGVGAAHHSNGAVRLPTVKGSECKSLVCQSRSESFSELPDPETETFPWDTCGISCDIISVKSCDASVRSCDQDIWEWDTVPPESCDLCCESGCDQWDRVSSRGFNWRNLVGKNLLNFRGQVVKLDSEWECDTKNPETDVHSTIPVNDDPIAEWEWDTVPSELHHLLSFSFHKFPGIPEVESQTLTGPGGLVGVAEGNLSGPPSVHSCSPLSCRLAHSRGRHQSKEQDKTKDRNSTNNGSTHLPRPDSPDSLDDFDWDWSLLPSRASGDPAEQLAGKESSTDPVLPSPDTCSSSKPFLPAASPTSPTWATSELMKVRSVSKITDASDDDDDDDFWGDASSSRAVLSGRHFMPGDYRQDSSSTIGGGEDQLVPGTISKVRCSTISKVKYSTISLYLKLDMHYYL